MRRGGMPRMPGLDIGDDTLTKIARIKCGIANHLPLGKSPNSPSRNPDARFKLTIRRSNVAGISRRYEMRSAWGAGNGLQR